MKAIQRLKQYIDYKGFTNSSFEKKNELSNGYIATQLKRNADLGEGVILKILDNCLDLNPEWLLTGKGNMLKTDVKTNISQTITGDSNIQSGNNTNITGDCKEKVQELQKQLQECKEQLREKENQVSQLINTVTALSQSKTTK